MTLQSSITTVPHGPTAECLPIPVAECLPIPVADFLPIPVAERLPIPVAEFLPIPVAEFLPAPGLPVPAPGTPHASRTDDQLASLWVMETISVSPSEILKWEPVSLIGQPSDLNFIVQNN